MPIFASVAMWDNGPEVPNACILSGDFGVRFCATNKVVQFFVYCKKVHLSVTPARIGPVKLRPKNLKKLRKIKAEKLKTKNSELRAEN